MIRVPSSPRLMRPLFSVMHSPRLTKRNGVLTRIAPPSTSSGTLHKPMVSPATRLPPRRLEPGQAAIDRVAGQDEDEDDALQHHRRGVRQAEMALQEPAA